MNPPRRIGAGESRPQKEMRRCKENHGEAYSDRACHSSSPYFLPRPGILITKPRLEIDANDWKHSPATHSNKQKGGGYIFAKAKAGRTLPRSTACSSPLATRHCSPNRNNLRLESRLIPWKQNSKLLLIATKTVFPDLPLDQAKHPPWFRAALLLKSLD